MASLIDESRALSFPFLCGNNYRLFGQVEYAPEVLLA